MAGTPVDAGAIIGGILLPDSISDRVAKAYDFALFHGAKLEALPDILNRAIPVSSSTPPTSRPRRSGASRAITWATIASGWSSVRCVARRGGAPLPPHSHRCFRPPSSISKQPVVNTPGADLYKPPYTTTAILSDGGVYDNLGLETIAKRYPTLLVSDAGQKIAPEENPHRDWARHSLECWTPWITRSGVFASVISSILMHARITLARTGEFGRPSSITSSWTTRSNARPGIRIAAREIPTRLEAMPENLQNRLMNWGYAICDAALRARLDPALQVKLGVKINPPKQFPFEGGY